MYKKANRVGLGNADSEEIAMFKGYSSEMDAYLRKGVLPGSEALTQISEHLARKSMVTQNELKIKSAAQAISDENNADSGFLLFDTKKFCTHFQ